MGFNKRRMESERAAVAAKEAEARSHPNHFKQAKGKRDRCNPHVHH
jgi:hypothetical protein